MQDYDFGLAPYPPDHFVQNGAEAVPRAYADATACCNLEFKVGCQPGVCLCAQASVPEALTRMYVASQLPGLGELTARYARERLHRRSLLFAGDSTTRRLFYAVCAFLGEKVFADRHGAAHRPLACPEGGWNDTLVQEAGVELSFVWAPKLQDLDEQVPRLRGSADVVLTSVYHHDRLQGTAKDFPRSLAKIRRQLGGNLVVVAPNLLSHRVKDARHLNPAILAVGAALEWQLAGPGTAVVGNAWQAAVFGDREACLGDTFGQGIHMTNDCGQRLRAKGALAAALRLLEAPRETMPRTLRRLQRRACRP